MLLASVACILVFYIGRSGRNYLLYGETGLKQNAALTCLDLKAPYETSSGRSGRCLVRRESLSNDLRSF